MPAIGCDGQSQQPTLAVGGADQVGHVEHRLVEQQEPVAVGLGLYDLPRTLRDQQRISLRCGHDRDRGVGPQPGVDRSHLGHGAPVGRVGTPGVA